MNGFPCFLRRALRIVVLCVSGSLAQPAGHAGDAPAPAPFPEVPVIPGHVAETECLAAPPSDGDTVFAARWDGPLRVLADGTPAAVEESRAPDGRRVLRWRGGVPAGGPVCVARYRAPALPNPRARLGDPDAVPVLPVDGASGAVAGSVPEGWNEARFELDTSAQELALAGSKSLAITAGDGGGVGVDAALVLNVNGKLADNVFIEGRLSDQSTPVQPEGTTTTLRELDEKYLRVYGRQYEYLLGDYVLQHGRAGEDLYAIQAEGARARYGENGRAGQVQFARSKGLFHSDTLRGVDGKQRGYYLRGRDGGTFITVLAGTERIYRNGAPLRRGVDYVIDYAQGRVDFLAPVWVTGENLFFAEFQYTEESYPRSVVSGSYADTLGAFRFGVRAIQESEDPDHPAAGTPDAAALAAYRQAGDGPVADSLGVLPMPQRRAAVAAEAGWEGGEAGHASFSVLGSLLDRNLYSPLDDDDNLGVSTRYRGVHRLGAPLDRGGSGRWILEPEHEHRSRDYAAFGQAVEPRGFRDLWNLDAAIGERDFDANRLRLGYEVLEGVMVGVGGGHARGRLPDSAGRAAASSVRGEAFFRGYGFDLSVEAKRASDTLSRDNDRAQLRTDHALAGWLLQTGVVRDFWRTELDGGGAAESEQWRPRLSLESPALAGRWSWSPEADVWLVRSNYARAGEARRDSVVDAGLAQRLRLLGWGPFLGDVRLARRHLRVWAPDGFGNRPLEPEVAVYDEAEANLSAVNHLRGYGVQTGYRASRTSETPLVEAYERVEAGRGDYLYDSLLNTYYRVETGGDHILVGLVQDSLLGGRPYQDMQWNLRVDLAPGKWTGPLQVAGGVLRDIEFGLDVETVHQDSASSALPLPRFTDAQIDAVRSGRARYEPVLHWTHPEGTRAATLRWRREYAKGAGLYAYRERMTETRAEYRHEWTSQWEGVAVGALEARLRESLDGFGAPSRADARRVQGLLYHRMPSGITLVPSLEYRVATGENAGFPLDLRALVPRARVEKGNFFGGRAFAEYGLHWLHGTGEGGYFVTEGFRRGVTHRIEAVAQSAPHDNLHLNATWLARLEPGASEWTQRVSAEVRAVF